MTVASVWLPFPPTVNNLYAQATVKGVTRRFPTKKYKAWRREAQVRIGLTRLPHFAGPVVIRVGLTPPSAARRDVDNYNKAVLDSLVEARVLRDDSQVQKLLAVWDHDGDEPGALVEIATVDTERQPLTSAERRALAKIRREGFRIGSHASLSESLRGLAAKGYIAEIPGLFEGMPQGFAPAE